MSQGSDVRNYDLIHTDSLAQKPLGLSPEMPVHLRSVRNRIQGWQTWDTGIRGMGMLYLISLKPSAFKQTPDAGGCARGGMGDEGDREHRGDSHLSIQEGNYT